MSPTTTSTAQLSEAAAEYVENLPELPPIPELPPLADGQLGAGDAPTPTPQPQQGDTPSGTVAGNTTMAFTANLDAAHKNDLLNAFGFVQLHAVQTYGFDPTKDPVGYYNQCIKSLTTIGFTNQGLTFANYSFQTQTFELDQVVLSIVKGLLTAGEITLVEAAVTALQSSANDSGAPWTIYSHSSQGENTGGFSIATADETNGSVAVAMSAFDFTGTENQTKFLWMNYKSSQVSMQNGSTTLALNDSIYDGVSATIAAQMAAAAGTYIANLPPLQIPS